jgi:hypothetical protein
MKKFIVLYLAPTAVIDDWAKTDPEKRKTAEEKLRGEWQRWMGEYARMIKDTAACGKTKTVSPNGVADTRNEIMMYSFVEAESHETAAKAFENHPHLQIPKSSIEVMEVRPMGGK